MNRYIVATLVALTLVPELALAEQAGSEFTPAQQAAIGKIAADYLVAHPEVLLQVGQKLQAQQEQQQQQVAVQAAVNKVDALVNDAETPHVGSQDAAVAVVEFFDYQCMYCSQMAPVVEKSIKANPNVRFVFKEWPIFGSRWPVSVAAAETGMAVWKEKGAQAYLDYHNAIYASGHDEGQLTKNDVAAAVKLAKGSVPSEEKLKATHQALNSNDQLARGLGFNGTPGFIVMPVKGATTANTSVLPGAVSLDDLQAAITKAQGSK
jgi:protein-disulfide isomerase